MDNANTIENQRASQLNQGRFQGKKLSSGGLIASRIGADLATGGIGKAVRKEAERRMSGAVIGAADKAAESYKKKRGGEGSSQKKLSGFSFWLIFAMVVVKEILDIILDVTVVLSILAWFIGICVIFIVYFYLVTQGVSFVSRRLVMWLISILIEMIPFLNILPTMPIMLLVLKAMEKNEFLKNEMELAQKMV